MPAILPTNISSRSVAVVGAGTLDRRIALQDVDEMWKINMGTQLGPFRLMDQAEGRAQAALDRDLFL